MTGDGGFLKIPRPQLMSEKCADPQCAGANVAADAHGEGRGEEFQVRETAGQLVPEVGKFFFVGKCSGHADF